jgi:hypothetical protein
VALSTSISTVSEPTKVLLRDVRRQMGAYCTGTTSFGSLPGVAPKENGASACS